MMFLGTNSERNLLVSCMYELEVTKFKLKNTNLPQNNPSVPTSEQQRQDPPNRSKPLSLKLVASSSQKEEWINFHQRQMDS